MRVLPVAVAVLSLFGFPGTGNATVADYTKYYYFDYQFYSGQFNIFVDTMYSWPDGTIWFHDLDETTPLQSQPMFEFGFFLSSLDVEELVGSPVTVSSASDVDVRRGMGGIYLFRPHDFVGWDDDYGSYSYAEGTLSFDRDLNIIAWDVLGWSCYACNSDHASSSPTPLQSLWDDLLSDSIDWSFPTGTDFPDGGYYSSNYWEPYELMFSTAIGRWEKRTSVFCWSHALDDEIACPEDSAGPTPIPLPASLPLLAGGLILLGAGRRFRRTVS